MAPSAIQIIIVVLLVMVLFGTGRIPIIMENLAKGINSFKKGLKDEGGEPSKPEDKKAEEGTSDKNSKTE